MSTTLRDFIAQRKAEIRAQLVALRREAKELRAAEKILSSDVERPEMPVAVSASGKKGMPTIQTMVLDVLGRRPAGADAWAIIEMIRQLYGVKIARQSLSPQLSRLKEAHKVEMDKKIWRLTKVSGQKNETPDALTSEVSNSDDQGNDDDPLS